MKANYSFFFLPKAAPPFVLYLLFLFFSLMRVPLYNHHNKKLLYGSSKGNERKHDDRKAMKDLKFVFFFYCLSLHLVKTPQFHLFFFYLFFFFRYLYTRSFTLFFFFFSGSQG